jgi:Tol biopolymer transport system component
MDRSRLAAASFVSAILAASVPSAQVVRQVTDDLTTLAGPGALDDAGSWVFTGSSADLSGTNPDHAFQLLRFDALTGTGTALTSIPGGVSVAVSVSDDGQWLAFVSPSDLTGQNHDQSPELFVMRPDGTGLAQLTNDPAVNAGSVGQAVLAGGGSRVVFVANTDPLGSNPGHLGQLFAVDRDGTNLTQLTLFASGSIGAVSVSDDGTRVAFGHDGDPLGANSDLGDEVFAISGDGTGLRQLTATPAGYGSGAPSISGNGLKVAFQSDGDLTGVNPQHQDEIFAIDWDGTGLRQLTRTTAVFGFTGQPGSQAPSMRDDGARVFYHSNHNTIFINFDGNYEIFSIGTDGTGLDQVTSTFLEIGGLLPVVSGDGSRIAYYGVGSAFRLEVEEGDGGNHHNLVEFELVLNSSPELSDDGSRVVFVQSTGLYAPSQLWRVQHDASDRFQITNLASGGAASPSVAADNETIVFSADSNPSPPANDDGSREIFRIRADGTGLVQLTSGAADTASENPVISAGATQVVFDSDADLLGTNPDGSREVYAMRADGTGLAQLTSGPAGTQSRLPRVDDGGVWVVFESNADLDGGNPDGTYEVHRVRTDGTGLERLTGDAALDSRAPDISGAGGRIAFGSAADLLGTNPEHNAEIYVYEPDPPALRQLTSTAAGSSGSPRISAGGVWVYFTSSAPIFEDDPDDPTDLYRVPAAGGPIQRVGALRAGAPGAASPDGAGERAAFSGAGDFTEQNPDLSPEIWVLDRLGQPEIRVSPASPTVVSWTHESGPLRYDVLRGDVASLGLRPDSTVDLGAVVCLEDDSPDATTAGSGDPADPPLGHAFFFVYRGTQGVLDGPGSYGRSSAGGERIPASGDCGS